jgi:hypothetical protein
MCTYESRERQEYAHPTRRSNYFCKWILVVSLAAPLASKCGSRGASVIELFYIVILCRNKYEGTCVITMGRLQRMGMGASSEQQHLDRSSTASGS